MTLSVLTWISIGAQVYPPNYPIRPISVQGCNVGNTTGLNHTLPVVHILEYVTCYYRVVFM